MTKLLKDFKPTRPKRLKEIQIRLSDIEQDTRKNIFVDPEEYEVFKTAVAREYDLGVSAFFRQVIKQTLKQLNA